MFVRQNPGRLLLISRQLVSLVCAQVRGVGEARDSWVSNGGDFFGDGWASSGNVTPLYHGVSIGVVFAPTSFVGSSSWGIGKNRSGSVKLFLCCVDGIVHLQNFFNACCEFWTVV